MLALIHGSYYQKQPVISLAFLVSNLFILLTFPLLLIVENLLCRQGVYAVGILGSL